MSRGVRAKGTHYGDIVIQWFLRSMITDFRSDLKK